MRKRVLVVDDSKIALNLLCSAVAKQYEVLTALDGEEAVESALRLRPDLILMDVVMPHMTGIEACRELRQNPETADIPIILLSTQRETDFVEQGFVSGCTEYLTKPVQLEDLKKVVEAYLDC